MKKKTLALILALAALLSLSAFAVFADPGTSDDPLVSKSYVDAQIASVKAQSSGTYSVVHIDAGQSVIGKEGTEIIVRAGVVTAIDNGANGVSDLTTGKDLMSGTEIGLNHLVLVPRDDGRGVKAWTESYLMVRGGYTLK
ncbi:MAG: hypothetical protein E7228_04615 [Clostridiales bacterium]|nr:hypothetical protein [Clostridiales bacterium]MBR6700147.1 hypothetical protein [Bacillota bacterium]